MTTICDLCGGPADPVCRFVCEVPPLPDAPQGRREEVQLCERCYLNHVEGLAHVDREVRR